MTGGYFRTRRVTTPHERFIGRYYTDNPVPRVTYYTYEGVAWTSGQKRVRTTQTRAARYCRRNRSLAGFRFLGESAERTTDPRCRLMPRWALYVIDCNKYLLYDFFFFFFFCVLFCFFL